VLLGWIFLTRPYDAVLWGAAFAGFLVVRDRARWRSLVRPFVLTGIGALPLVGLALVYNHHVTGGWLRFPITVADPLDTFGFGRKRLMPSFEPVDYGLGKAVRATAKNAFVLPWFLVGTYVGLVTAGVGLWQRRRDVSTLALILLSAVFPLGYFVFWGNHLSSLAARISGPIYLIPIYAPLCLLIGSVLVGWWETRRRLAWALLAALLVATVPAAVSRFDVNRDISVQQAPWRDSVAGLRGEALVYVADTARYVLYMNPFSSNGPDLDDRILYAAGGSPSMLEHMAAMPLSTAYLQRASVPSQEVGPREHPYDLQVSLTPVEVRSGPSLTVTVTLDPPAGASHASLRIQAGAVDVRRAVELDDDGVSTDRFVVGLPTSTDDTEIPLDERGAIRVTVGYGDSAAAAAGDPTARHTLQYRVVDGTIEVLLPSTEQRNMPVGRNRQWRHVVGLPELRLDVAP
jgi:hypothetical protein